MWYILCNITVPPGAASYPLYEVHRNNMRFHLPRYEYFNEADIWLSRIATLLLSKPRKNSAHVNKYVINT